MPNRVSCQQVAIYSGGGSMLDEINLTEEQLRENLKEQLKFLKKSAEEFGKGDVSEAKRLAVTIRLLLHDTRKSASLLGQLRIKNNMAYLDTSNTYNPNNLMPHTGLVSIYYSSEMPSPIYRPRFNQLAHTYTTVDFNTWWSNNIVIKDQINNIFTRKNLVLFVADKDGGAHVDRALDIDYYQLKNNSVGWKFLEKSNGDISEKNLTETELVSIRQIAFELFQSIQKYYPELLG